MIGWGGVLPSHCRLPWFACSCVSSVPTRSGSLTRGPAALVSPPTGGDQGGAGQGGCQPSSPITGPRAGADKGPWGRVCGVGVSLMHYVAENRLRQRTINTGPGEQLPGNCPVGAEMLLHPLSSAHWHSHGQLLLTGGPEVPSCSWSPPTLIILHRFCLKSLCLSLPAFSTRANLPEAHSDCSPPQPSVAPHCPRTNSDDLDGNPSLPQLPGRFFHPTRQRDTFWMYFPLSGTCRCLVVKSCLTLATLRTIAHQAPLSMGFPRQEYWSGLPFPSPENLPKPEIEPASLVLAGGFFTTESPGKPGKCCYYWLKCPPCPCSSSPTNLPYFSVSN